MILSDLDYLIPAAEKSEIVGGNTFTDTIATTSPNMAYAGGIAFANGDNTYTNVETRTKLYRIENFGSISFAYAHSLAYARTDNNRQMDRSVSISLSIYI